MTMDDTYNVHHKLFANLQGDDKGVLACEEDIHVADQLVVSDQHQPEHKEGGILKYHNDLIQSAY